MRCILLLLLLLLLLAAVSAALPDRQSQQQQHQLPVYFINLDRRQDRKKYMEEQLDALPKSMFYVERWRASDGVKVSEEHLKLFNNSDFMDLHVDRANKIMGCALSHFTLWKHVVARGDPFAVVLEDDATLSQGFAEGVQVLKRDIPMTSKSTVLVRIGLGAFQAKLAELIPVEAVPEDIGLIGTVNYKHWPFPMDNNYNPAIYSQRYPNELPDSIRKCREEVQPCTIAYLITLEGARSLVQHVESNGFPKAVDIFMNDFLIARDRHYITDRILATTTFLKFGSDID